MTINMTQDKHDDKYDTRFEDKLRLMAHGCEELIIKFYTL